MQIRYTATSRDISALIQHRLQHSRRFWGMLVALALFPTAMIIVLLLVTRGPFTSAALTPGLVFGVLLAVAFPAIVIWGRKREERFLSIDPEGIQTSIGKLSGVVTWPEIASVDETPDYIFITATNSDGFAIPGRAFATPAERDSFLRQLAEYRRTTQS